MPERERDDALTFPTGETKEKKKKETTEGKRKGNGHWLSEKRRNPLHPVAQEGKREKNRRIKLDKEGKKKEKEPTSCDTPDAIIEKLSQAPCREKKRERRK